MDDYIYGALLIGIAFLMMLNPPLDSTEWFIVLYTAFAVAGLGVIVRRWFLNNQ